LLLCWLSLIGIEIEIDSDPDFDQTAKKSEKELHIYRFPQAEKFTGNCWCQIRSRRWAGPDLPFPGNLIIIFNNRTVRLS